MRGVYLHGFGWSKDTTRVYPFIILETQNHVPEPVRKKHYKTLGRPSRAAAGPPPGRRRAAAWPPGHVQGPSFLISFLPGPPTSLASRLYSSAAWILV